MEKAKKTFSQKASTVFYKAEYLLKEVVAVIYFCLAVILIAMVLMVFNPLVLWPIAAISKSGMKFAMSLTEPMDILDVRGLYQGLFNKLPLSRKLMFPKEFDFSAEEQRKIAQKYGKVQLFELNEIAPEIIKEQLVANHLFRMEYIAKRNVTSEQADIIYDSGDKEAVYKLLVKRCPSASQAEYLLSIPELLTLLPVYAANHAPGYAFLQKAKERLTAEQYQAIIDILNDKADAQIFSEYQQKQNGNMLERAKEAAKRKLGKRGQRALLDCREMNLVNLYLEHDALDEVLVMKFSGVETSFARNLFKAIWCKNQLSDDAKAILRQGPHAEVIA